MGNPNSVEKVYGQIAGEYAAKFSEPSDHIDEFLKLVKPGGKILDVGSGPGVDSAYMVGKGFNVTGVDSSEEMLTLAREKNPEIVFKTADMRSLPFANGSFDAILASFSLIHIPKTDMPQTISGFNHVLADNGVICIGIQEGRSEEVYVDEPLRPIIEEKVFLNIMSAEELKEFLETHGFKILKEFLRETENKEEFDFRKFVVIAQKTNPDPSASAETEERRQNGLTMSHRFGTEPE